MDEYIKREDALDAVLFALVGTGYQSTAIHSIRDVQTADVALRAELAREILEELKRYMINHCCLSDDDVDAIWKHIVKLEKKYTEGTNETRN